LKPTVTRCPKCGQRRKRSNPANSRLWLLYHLASDKLHPDGKTYSADQFHIYYKTRFLGCEEILLPNGHVAQIPMSTAELSVDDFAQYMEAVEADLVSRGVFLEDLQKC
jgi:hypothetical protein